MKLLPKTIWIVLFALAMGYLESAVVVYLRELYYPEGFNFPMKAMSRSLAVTELYREAATLIMILGVSVLSAGKRILRFAWFLVVFAVWDLAYYLFLKIILDWPSSLLTTDILFLLPGIWTGPVIAPVINSFTMLLLAAVILVSTNEYGSVIRISKIAWCLLVAGSLIVLIAYLKDFSTYAFDYNRLHVQTRISGENRMLFLSTQFVPRSFDWLLFGIGFLMHISAILLIFKDKKKRLSRF